ncbi:MAG TPA: cytochrome c3 family protein [Anaeromyxobacteraceae bacterium]|nr:cytochrome c3 family protein [Anaeromyxobacteraceae bacterium]
MVRRPLFSAALAVGAVLMAGLTIAGVVRLVDYVDNDPGLCAQCHRASPEFALWTRGSHRSVACQRCHHSSRPQQLAMLRAFLAGRSPADRQEHASVQVGACAACHLSHDANWPQVGGSRGHLVHVEQRKIACVTCHAAGVHGFEPVVTACRSCHGEHGVREAGMGKLHCFACHDFLSADPGLRPTRRDCLRCHRAEGVLPARFSDDAPMQFDCGECHKPHARPPQAEHVACETCHAGMAKAGLHGWRGHGGACAACHKAHVWRTGRADCLRCHPQGGGERCGHALAQGRDCAGCHGFRGAARPLGPKLRP